MSREIPVFTDPAAVAVQNRGLRTLNAALEAEIATHREQARKYYEAVKTLDSEREANARLTDDLLAYAADCAKLHEVQHGGECLVRPRGGASIILWAAEEIAALRASSTAKASEVTG